MRPRSNPPRQRAIRQDACQAALLESARLGRREDLKRAKAFALIDASNHFAFEGCDNIGEFGLRMGYGSRQAREYAAAGRVLEAAPLAEAMLLEGQVCISTLALLEPWFTDEELRPTDAHDDLVTPEAILEWARLLPDSEIRRAVQRSQAAARLGADPIPCTLLLSLQGIRDLERTKILISRKERRGVARAEAAERAFRFYVEKHDLLEKKPRARRAPPMPARSDGKKNPRSIPAEVRRALMERYDDVCCIEFCENRIFLENAHHIAHALGGGNEVDDQDRICSGHHLMKDHGEIRWVPPQGDVDGHYLTREGGILRLKPRKPREARETGNAGTGNAGTGNAGRPPGRTTKPAPKPATGRAEEPSPAKPARQSPGEPARAPPEAAADPPATPGDAPGKTGHDPAADPPGDPAGGLARGSPEGPPADVPGFDEPGLKGSDCVRESTLPLVASSSGRRRPSRAQAEQRFREMA